MDPAPIGALEWKEIYNLLTNLWMVVAFTVLFAANMIIGHIIIPSHIATKDIPENLFQKVRVGLYTVALLSIGLALFFFIRVVDLADVIQDFWSESWI